MSESVSPTHYAKVFILSVTMILTALTSVVAEDLETLKTWMTGSYSSAAQAERLEDYRDIRLEMVQIWPDRTDGVWLYVEQAAAEGLDRPYRQRIYRVFETEENGFVSQVYTFGEPLTLAGAWQDPLRFNNLRREDLSLREGCAVWLSWDEDSREFTGSTMAKGCKSSLGGASYATSEVVVRSNGIESWDRGFNAEDTQVWGAESGAYIFDKNE